LNEEQWEAIERRDFLSASFGKDPIPPKKAVASAPHVEQLLWWS
jgi:hypothetical protein